MKSYVYIKGNSNISVGMANDYESNELLEWAKAHVPKGCPFFLLTDEDVTAIGTTPPEAISFDVSQADGFGEAE